MLVGIGIDITEISRIEKTIKSHGSKFLKRVFTPYEIKLSTKQKNNIFQYFASRFAAKESFLKAIKTGWGTKQSPEWKDIEIKSSRQNAVTITLYNKAKKISNYLKIKKIYLSLTHIEELAIAVVVLEK